MDTLTYLTLENLIQVKAPYYCLFDVIPISDSSLCAKVRNEYLDEKEHGPIAGGEAGRHLAICGSLQLARAYNYNEPAYFLAIGATITRDNLEVSASDFYELTVHQKEIGKRNAVVEGTISNANGTAIFTVEIQYQVLRNSVFSKLFAGNKVETPTLDFNPYMDRKHLSEIVVNGKEARATYGVVHPEDCKGHFENYPALPVAIVANLYAELGFALYHALTENKFEKIALLESEISAERLAFSGEKVDFELHAVEVLSENNISFKGSVSSEGKVISRASFVFCGA